MRRLKNEFLQCFDGVRETLMGPVGEREKMGFCQIAFLGGAIQQMLEHYSKQIVCSDL